MTKPEVMIIAYPGQADRLIHHQSRRSHLKYPTIHEIRPATVDETFVIPADITVLVCISQVLDQIIEIVPDTVQYLIILSQASPQSLVSSEQSLKLQQKQITLLTPPYIPSSES